MSEEGRTDGFPGRSIIPPIATRLVGEFMAVGVSHDRSFSGISHAPRVVGTFRRSSAGSGWLARGVCFAAAVHHVRSATARGGVDLRA